MSRFSSEMLRVVRQNVDILFVDDTFLDPRCEFPTRNEAYSFIVDCIRRHPQHRILIGTDSLGKEEILLKIAEDFETLVRSFFV